VTLWVIARRGARGWPPRMLGAELKAYDKKVAAAPAPVPASGPPLLDSLSLSDAPAPPHVSRPMYSQSLPSSSHMSFMAPPKPRVRPSPSNSLKVPPILELPEPSPLSNSLLHAMGEMGEVGRGIPEEEEEAGGMSMFDPPAPRRQQHAPLAASAPATMLWGPGGPGRITSSGLGGRTPSKTLLEAMTAAPT